MTNEGISIHTLEGLDSVQYNEVVSGGERSFNVTGFKRGPGERRSSGKILGSFRFERDAREYCELIRRGDLAEAAQLTQNVPWEYSEVF